MAEPFAPSIRYVYFDFDNVLVRRTQNRATLTAQLLGLPDPVRLRQFYFTEFHHDSALEQRYAKLRTVPEEVVFYRDLFQLFTRCEGVAASEAQLRAAAEAFVHVPFEVLPGARSGLELLQLQYGLGIFTNGLPSRHQEIAASGLDQYFNRTVISCDYGMEKPARELYEKAIGVTSMPAANIALVDDEPVNVAGAQAAGFGQAILFTPAFWPQVH